MKQTVKAQKRFPTFQENFRKLQGERSNTEFAKFLGMSRQTVGFYCNGDRVPDALVIRDIAEKCGVSADWLLGLSKFEQLNGEERQICDYLGLSEEAVQVFVGLKNSPLEYKSGIANYVLTCSNFFQEVIEYLASCAWDSVEPGRVLGYTSPSEKDIEDFKKNFVEMSGSEHILDYVDSRVLSYQLSMPILNISGAFQESIMFSQVIKTLTRLYDHFKEECAEEEEFIDAVVNEYVDSYKSGRKILESLNEKAKTALSDTSTEDGYRAEDKV